MIPEGRKLRIGVARPPRPLPEEVAVALVFNGSTEAVMMASPYDLEDFATGFAKTEAICNPVDITGIEPVEVERGIDLRIWLRPEVAGQLGLRRRAMLGPVGCGLCGIDSLEKAMRRLPALADGGFFISTSEIYASLAALPDLQLLHRESHAVHGAMFWRPGLPAVLREDVGRHNALDKLAGHLLRQGVDPASGAVVITSRVSVDMVQKVAATGSPVLIALSSPTTAAVQLARDLNMTLIAGARSDGFDVFSAPHRLIEEQDYEQR